MKKFLIKGAVKCDLCGDIIISRARHDYHKCSCNNVTIDGGGYLVYGNNEVKTPSFLSGSSRVGGKVESSYSIIDYEKGFPVENYFELQALLFNDWNKREDKYKILKKGDLHNNGINRG